MGITDLMVTAGRKKIVYNPNDLERMPLLTVVCGMKGVGKTYQTIKKILNCIFYL